MSIKFTYEIINVDEAARCMELRFEAAGYPTMHVGARLPYVGETLEAVAISFAPLAFWEESQKEVVVPSVGQKGEVVPVAEDTQVPTMIDQTTL